MRWAYLSLAIVGTVVPYWMFVPWLAQHGLDLPLFFKELFSNRIGAFFGVDVILSAVVLVTFIRQEGRKHPTRGLWLPIAATCLIGVSCGLPLYLYLRERRVR
jgi:hypothetical protein